MTSHDIEMIRTLARTECNLILTKWTVIVITTVVLFLEARRVWTLW